MRARGFILHLARASKRRSNAQILLENCAMEAEIWPAVDGSALPATDLNCVRGTRLFESNYPFDLKTGELGCFLSHRQIWAEILQRDLEAALIIEDDAGLDPEGFKTALDLALRHIKSLGYIQFQTRKTTGAAAQIDSSGACDLFVPEQAGLRTTAQLVSRQAAARFLSLSETVDRPVDTFVQSHWHTGLRPAVIYPSGISEIADALDGSTIQGGKKPILEKLRREVSRAGYRVAVKRLSRQSVAPVKGGFDG